MFPSDEEFVKHIRDEIKLIQQFMAGKTVDDLHTDFMLEHAVTRCLEIMGEASRKISAEFKEFHPELPWRDMQDTRNRIIHFYFGIDHEVIMNIILAELPSLLQSIEQLIIESHQQSKSSDLLSGNTNSDDLLTQDSEEQKKGKKI
ncbi:MAG: HepT-like ribonuclease domain-containing protein [Bacteroidota bacterium]